MKRVTLLMTLVALCGCGPDGWIRLSVEPQGLTVGEDIDQLWITIVASESRDTSRSSKVCRFIERQIGAEEDEVLDFPVEIVIEPGAEQSWSCVAVRIDGRLGSQTAIFAEDLFCPDFDEEPDETIILHGDCLYDGTTPPCDDGMVCMPRAAGGVECVGPPAGSLFEAEPTGELWCDGAI